MSENKSKISIKARIAALKLRQKLILFSLFLYWPALFVLAHIPIPRMVRTADVSDKSLHFLAYLILAFFLWFAINNDKKVNWRRAGAWIILCLIVAYSLVDEISQPYVGRTCDAMDLTANLAGSLTGLILFTIFSFWPSALIVTGMVIFGLSNIAKANLTELLPVLYPVFHIFAYGLFTILWIQVLRVYRKDQAPGAGWLIVALAVPLVFMLSVKIVSSLLGSAIETGQILISAGSIVFVIAVIFFFSLFRRRAGKG